MSKSKSRSGSRRKPKKTTQWADGGGETTNQDRQSPLEIVIDDGGLIPDMVDSDEVINSTAHGVFADFLI